MDNLIYGNIVKVDLDKPLLRTNVGTVMASGDENANRYGARLHRSGTDVDAFPYSVLGYLIRPNDETLKIHGTASENMVYVDIPQTGYVYDGAFTLTIKVYGNGFEKAIVIFDGHIAKTTSETIVDGDRVVYGVEEILAQIDAMEKAEADALAAAEKATEAASKAPYVGSNGNWYVWDAEANTYKDSGTKATGDDGDDGDDGITPNITFTAATGEPGSNVQISQSGTAENPVVNLTIPRGIPGEGSVSSVNGVFPDANGNVEIDAGGGTVQSVNNVAPDESGNITLSASDVGAMPESYAAPVLSVNQKTGSVTLTASDIGALASDGTAADSSKLGGKLPEEYMLAADAGDLGGLKMDLLWVNASPASSFAAQSVTLDLTEYTHFLIFVSIKSSTGIEVYGICEKAGKYRIGAAGTTNRFRDATPSDGGIALSDGYNVTKYDSATVYNDEMVPTRIYGIKGVNMTV